MKWRTSFRPQFEQLDDRAMPSVSLVNGILTIGGTAGADMIQVTRAAAGRIQVSVSNTGEVRQFSESSVNRIDVNSGDGSDRIVIGPAITIGSNVHCGRGSDTVLGGGGADNIFGGLGNDHLRGRGGNDDLNGDDGNDDIRGGRGDDHMNGGRGRDGCHGGDGNDDVQNGTNLETELIATFTGGQGDAEFKFGPDDGGIEREFEVEVEDLPARATLGVFVDGVSVGMITTNSFGDGRLEYELDFDNGNSATNFPPGFPEIHVGSSITVTLNGNIVRSGTFVVNPNP